MVLMYDYGSRFGQIHKYIFIIEILKRIEFCGAKILPSIQPYVD